MPLFEGEVPMQLLGELRNQPASDIACLVEGWCESGADLSKSCEMANSWFVGSGLDESLKPKLAAGAASVFVRIADEQLGPDVVKPFINPDPEFLPQGTRRNKYLRATSDGTKFREIVPEGMSADKYLTATNSAISKITQISE